MLHIYQMIVETDIYIALHTTEIGTCTHSIADNTKIENTKLRQKIMSNYWWTFTPFIHVTLRFDKILILQITVLNFTNKEAYLLNVGQLVVGSNQTQTI